MTKGNTELVRASKLFDEEWYLRKYRDVSMQSVSPLEHFLQLGWKLDRDPGPFFSTRRYLELNPGVRKSGENPLLHHLRLIADLPPPPPTRAWRTARRRVAIFASFSAKSKLETYVRLYLEGLKKVCHSIVFVADNDLPAKDEAYLRSSGIHVILGRHGEYDFGSYKRGIALAIDRGLLLEADELILCNDSCYGPLSGLEQTFRKMDARALDFWGITQNSEFGEHIQSYFIVFKRKVFIDPDFRTYFMNVQSQNEVSKVVLLYEVPMTAYFSSRGYLWGTLIDESTPGYAKVRRDRSNITVWPLFKLSSGSPFLKVKAFNRILCNFDGIADSISRTRLLNLPVTDAILEHSSAERHINKKTVRFSIIIPFYNRRETIFSAIDSVLSQRHREFEIIAVDDGSTDGGLDLVRERYAKEVAAGRLVLARLSNRVGVSAARNLGLRKARNEWIAYVDSDNVIDPEFLEIFASLSIDYPERNCFYGWLRKSSDQKSSGSHYNRSKLIDGNFIDLGAFVHKRELFTRLGGFDESLKRLVDWDLIIRYTEKNPPVCIPRPMLTYTDNDNDTSRISVSIPFDNARIAIRKKFRMPFRVTTIIPTYNHEAYIERAVESALRQTGHIKHQILLCDDGSSDRTSKIVKRLAAAHPNVIRNLSTAENRGISRTFRSCIAASAGDFVAILEGDDEWTDAEKLHKQTQFLGEHTDCSMVFSRIVVRSEANAGDRFLDRQEKLGSKLDGADFLADPSMNLIANFSSCLFKGHLLRTAPSRLYEGRLNEIALAFYMERHGRIGFLSEPMSVYYQHSNGVWSGSSHEAQLRSGLEARQMVLDVADPKYADAIRAIMEEKYHKPLEQLSK